MPGKRTPTTATRASAHAMSIAPSQKLTFGTQQARPHLRRGGSPRAFGAWPLVARLVNWFSKSVPGSVRIRNPLIRVKDHGTGISKPRWVGGFAGMVPWQS
jgi:hypothetical protein